MTKKQLIVVTNAPREYLWEDSYTHNLSGQKDITEKVADNPSYRRGEICIIHPAIVRFYKERKSSFEEEITKGVSTVFPNVIDKTRERTTIPAFKFTPFAEDEIPALACNSQVSRGIFQEVHSQGFTFNYFLIPLKHEEFTEVAGKNIEAIIETLKINNIDADKFELKRKLAILQSFDTYLKQGTILIRDIPVELTKRAGTIDRHSLRKYSC